MNNHTAANLSEYIMSVDEHNKLNYKVPYTYTLGKEDQQVYFFGAAHTTDPRSAIFEQLKNVFEEFQPEVVIVEGLGAVALGEKREEYLNQIKSQDLDEVINTRAEPAFTVLQAESRRLAWDSPLANQADQIDFLLDRGYTHEEIFVWITLRQVYMYVRLQPDNRPSLEEFVMRGIDKLEKSVEWGDFKFNYASAVKLTAEISNIEIDPEKVAQLRNHLGPSSEPGANVYKRIWADSALYIDQLLLQMIMDYLKANSKVLVVFGAYHAVVLEPALKKLFDVA